MDKVLRKSTQQIETNESGRALWELCDGIRTIDEIVEALRAQFHSQGDEIRADVMHSVQSLADAGLLTSSDTSTDYAERLIDLREIPILIINAEDRPDRSAFMQRQMDEFELPFSFVRGVRHASSAIGCARAHLDANSSPGLTTPFLILEDDCEFNGEFHYRYMVPEDADALYLGVSGWGTTPPGMLGTAAWKGVRFTRFGPNYLRVFNMLGSHAKLYIKETYRQTVMTSAENLCHHEQHVDVVFAAHHLSHLVLTPNVPVCHQSRELGGQYQATCQSLLDM